MDPAILILSSRQSLSSAWVSTGRLGRVLSLSSVDNIRDIPGVPGHGVGHLLQTPVGQVDEVLALGVVAVPALSLPVVILSVVVRNSAMMNILYIKLYPKFYLLLWNFHIDTLRFMNILTLFSPVSVGVDWRLIRVGLHSGVALWHGLGHCEDKSGDEDNLENINVENMRSLGSSNVCMLYLHVCVCLFRV